MKMITETLTDLANIKLTTFLFYSLTTFTIVFVVSLISKTLKNNERASYYKTIAQKRRAERDQQVKLISLPPLNLSEALHKKILDSDATALIEMLKSSEVTSEQILIAYFQRASTIGIEYELITDIAFKEALLEARRCDQLRKENPSACEGALFGLPISVKDNMTLKGTDSACGAAARLNNPDKDDGYLIKILKAEGAIPFVKSNIPQAVFNINTRNNIWGWAKNPWNKTRITGGSSGGEGGLIAARCSPLGIGNDLGGSLRIPGLFCGIVAFKTTGDRVTRVGTAELGPMMDHLPNLKLVTGPMGKSVRDANLTMKALLSDKAQKNISLSEQDVHYMRIPWKEEEVFRKRKNLRVGYLKSMNSFPSSPANQRAVEEAVRALKRIGYEVIEVDFHILDDLAELFVECVFPDGEASYLKMLKGESTIPDLADFKLLATAPGVMMKMIRYALSALGQKRAALGLEKLEKKNAYELIQVAERQARLRKEFSKVWDEYRLDALISPGVATPAPEPAYAKDIGGYIGRFLAIMNVLDIPSGVVPVTVVKEGEDIYPQEITEHRDAIYEQTKKSMQGSVGLPVGVQVSTLPWQDEKCVGIMLDLEEQLQFRQKHPFPLPYKL